jgi:hypothetical protein
MKHIHALAIALLAAAGSTFAAGADSTDKVKDALAKLTGATNYSWTTTIKIPDMPFEPGPVKGRTEKGGYATVAQQFNENTMEAVFKGDKVAVKSEGGWQLLDEAEGPAAMMGGWLTANGTAGDEAAKLFKHVKELKAGEEDLFSGDLTTEGAGEFLMPRPRGGNTPPAPKNAKGSVKFWLKDGALTRLESHLQGAITFGPDQEERDFAMTRTIEIQNVGTTKVEVPAEARTKLETK